ncbi:MAG TPA: DoxX family protein [Candidatus Dormibacteraeota bacterium]|nr:DoxX family protein [Candidatus Dormibacteraeota bacterium]
MRKTLVRWTLVGIMGGSGVLHFTHPEFYRKIVPRPLGHPDKVVALSGAAELACAVTMVFPPTRRVGGWATAGLLLAVFPANIQMALDGGLKGAPFPANNAMLAWLRLPLQIPAILMALSVAREQEMEAALPR